MLSASLDSLIISTGQMYYAVLLVWIPALSAGIVKLKYNRKEKNVFRFSKCKLRYVVMALVVPFVYIGMPYCIYWVINPSSIQIAWSVNIISEVVLGMLSGMVLTLGEEIGWRGFLVPNIVRLFGVKKALLVSGLIWGAWHCPLVLSGIYLPGVAIWYAVPIFMIVITAVGVMIGILTIRSQSIWPAVLMHAAHNCYDQNIFGAGTIGVNKIYFVSEAGMITAVLVVIMAIWMYKKYIIR